MGFLKKNLKVIILVVIGVLLASCLTVYAVITANNVIYTDNQTVEEALNDLYKNKKETSDETQTITTNGNHTLDKYYKNLDVNVENKNVAFPSAIAWTAYQGPGYKDVHGSAENVLSGFTIGEPYLVQIVGGMEVDSNTTNLIYQLDGAKSTQLTRFTDYCGSKLQNNKYVE